MAEMREEERDLLQQLIKKGAAATKNELKKKAEGATVRALQVLLGDLGVEPLGKPGVYDEQTQQAVQKFAKKHGKSVRGLNVTLTLAGLILEDHAKLKPAGKKPPVQKKLPPVDTKPSVEQSLPVEQAVPVTGTPHAATAVAEPRDFRVATRGVTACLLQVEPVGQELEYWCWAATAQMMIGYLRSLDEAELPPVDLGGADPPDVTQGRQMNRRLQDREVDCAVAKGPGFDYEACDRGGWPYYFEFEGFVGCTKWGSRRHVVEEHGLVLLDGGPPLRLRQRLSHAQLQALTYESGREFKKRLDDTEGCALSWEMLTALLDARRPVAFTYRYPRRGGGHMRLAVGYVVTPGNQRWVAVADSLPPLSGEIHLIPYDYYRDGPFGGHWRDYWVAPAAEGWPTGLRRVSEELRVGTELEASYITYHKDWEPRKPSTGGQRLDDEDRATAYLEARAGLLAVEAIACAAEPMAARLGMGGASRLFSFGPHSSPAEAETASNESIKGGHRGVHPDSLKIEEVNRIPVYELTKKELEEWSPGCPPDLMSLARLLDKPREVIYEITYPQQRPLDFFAAVTVRRKGERWRVSSLGKTGLMGVLAGRQAGDAVANALASSGVEKFASLLLSGTDAPAEEKAEVLKSFRSMDDKERQTTQAQRDREIEDVTKSLEEDSAALPGELWRRRDARGEDSDVRVGWEPWVNFWSEFWAAIRNEDGRKWCRQTATHLATVENWVDLIPEPIQGHHRSEESLLDLVNREEEIVRLCSEWSSQDREGKDRLRVVVFAMCYQQEIAWLQRRFKKTDRDRLEEILDWRKLAEETNDGGLKIIRPKYILRVRELYQELIAFPTKDDREKGALLPRDEIAPPGEPALNDELEPVYPTTFHRPERAVAAGALMDVLLDLQDVAKGIAVRRGG